MHRYPFLSNTFSTDILYDRDNYIYLTLGTVLRPQSKKQITIELPNKLVDKSYPKSFFCNDILGFNPVGFSTNTLTNKNIKDYTNSIVSVKFGTEVLAKFTSDKFSDNYKNFLDVKRYGYFDKIVNYSLSYNSVLFNPEFMVKSKLNIVDSNVKFHLVGYSANEVQFVNNNISLTSKFNSNQILTHKNPIEFENYLIKRCNLL